MQVGEIKQVTNVVTKELPDSKAKGAMLKFLESEVNYYQQINQLSQERAARAKELSSIIIGPGGERIIPFAPLPFSDMLLVGWDKEGNEVYYNTDDGYYYTRDNPGGNKFTRFNGNYLDDNGTQHYAEREAESCGFWQWMYRLFGSDNQNLSFPDSFINKLDKVNKGRGPPNSDWFSFP